MQIIGLARLLNSYWLFQTLCFLFFISCQQNLYIYTKFHVGLLLIILHYLLSYVMVSFSLNRVFIVSLNVFTRDVARVDHQVGDIQATVGEPVKTKLNKEFASVSKT